jgi:hypothetical protein
MAPSMSDRRPGLNWLRTEAERGSPAARAVLTEIERLKADRARIPRGTLSKHGTHRWTGHRWTERDGWRP